MIWCNEIEELIKTEDVVRIKQIYRETSAHFAISKGELDYAFGLRLLEHCAICFSEEKYIYAVDLLIEAYNEHYAAEEIMNVILEVVYEANADGMKRAYEQNIAQLEVRYGAEGLYAFDEVPFVLFPVAEGHYRFYDKKQDRFLRIDEMNFAYYLYSLLMRNSLDDLQASIPKMILALKQDEEASVLFKQTTGESELALVQIERYRALRPQCEKYYWLMGMYFFQKMKYAEAEKAVKIGLGCRRLDFRLCLLMGEVCERLGAYEEAVKYYTLQLIHGNDSVKEKMRDCLLRCLITLKNISPERLKKALHNTSRTGTDSRLAPWSKICTLNENDTLSEHDWNYCNEYLKIYDHFDFFVGIYNEESRIGIQAEVTDRLKSMYVPTNWCINNIYDICRSGNAQELCCPKAESPYLISVAASENQQNISISLHGETRPAVLGKSEFKFFRIGQDTKITSDKIFYFTKPICLKHEHKRKKLVLNLFVDALSFAYLKRGNYQQMPNVMKFFSKGMIFNHNYSVAEWTFPSVAAMQTGMHMSKTQIFHPYANINLADHFKTIAERFNEKGYYCIDIMESMENIYNDVCRGYDRVIANFVTRAYVGVERAIRYLKALSETDVFMTMHFLDVHPPFTQDFQMDVVKQAKLDLKDWLFQTKTKSVHREKSKLNILHYEDAVKNVDRALGTLFSYLEANYQEEDLLVTFYSDHGVSIFEENGYLLSEDHTSTAFMFRGRDVPAVGIVDNEVTSALDLYHIMIHLEGDVIDENMFDSRLPKAFGGEGSDYAVSSSLYPGQTYKLCIRTMKHEFRFETLELTTNEGRINRNKFICKIYSRDERHVEIQDEQLKQYFLAIAYEHTSSLHDPVYGSDQ